MLEREVEVEFAGGGFEELQPVLRGRVFHVTPLAAWRRIQESGAISPNLGSRFETGFGSSKNSFFRNRGCISLFDFRTANDQQIEDVRWKCSPLQIAQHDRPAVILLLSPEIHERLIPWTEWEKEKAYSQMLVPYVECGYRGEIALSTITEVIIVRVTTHPESDRLEQILHNSWKQLE